MNRWLVALLSLVAALTASAQEASPLEGLWQHPDQPVIIEMQPVGELMEGKVHSNSDKPESVGKTIFRELRYDKKEQCWQGWVYVKRLDEEKATCLSLDNPNRFRMTVKVGFFSKTVKWQRVEG
ncbi:DUF2147 domain-containing protein [Oceanicoccus sagamiensis]|uniref:Uncharacterized protein n=1 Tax=Oceanicoccus sagamiensis TaxID=716816 RepID=A0A1X9NDQ1_9GAMM|nr:DUF2147 domain-containing protein [Oceanicoccus sagamiensis]ARN75184.1 hypothetical protein BST96_14295 [Oceanicoccus sagamiensis]